MAFDQACGVSMVFRIVTPNFLINFSLPRGLSVFTGLWLLCKLPPDSPLRFPKKIDGIPKLTVLDDLQKMDVDPTMRSEFRSLQPNIMKRAQDPIFLQVPCSADRPAMHRLQARREGTLSGVNRARWRGRSSKKLRRAFPHA